jgi:hypothetical protein
MAAKPTAPASQIKKENFIKEFEGIVKNNGQLRDNYKIQFFDTAARTNYVINGLNGKSINVLGDLSPEELERYKALKSNWQN